MSWPLKMTAYNMNREDFSPSQPQCDKYNLMTRQSTTGRPCCPGFTYQKVPIKSMNMDMVACLPTATPTGQLPRPR